MSVYAGNEAELGLLLGQGLSHIDLEVKGFAVDLGPLKRVSGNAISGQTTEFKLLEITSRSELNEALNISASFSFKSLTSNVGGRVNYANKVNKNNQSRYLMVHVRVANELELASDFKYKQNVQNFLIDPRNLQEAFSKQYGTEFVYGRRTGGQFYAVVEFDFTSRQEEEKFNAALSASGTGWKGSAEVNKELSRFDQSARMRVYMHKEGGSAGLPQITNITEFALNFDQAVASIQGSPITLELLTKDYTGVEPTNLQPNIQILVKQEVVMVQLAKNRDNALEALNSIQYIQKNVSNYNTNFSIHKLSLWEKELNNYINIINDAAVSCFADVFQGCTLPTAVSFPDITWPEKKENLTFSDQCSNKIGLSVGVRRCLDVLLSVAQTQDCSVASNVLSKLTDINLSSAQLEDVTLLSSLTNLRTLGLNENQITDISPLEPLKFLVKLHLSSNKIFDVKSLAYLINLQDIFLSFNQITNVTPLASLINLKTLYLVNNPITDITPLASLTNLIIFISTGNQIIDVTPLASLINLKTLHLNHNQITDVTPLASLINLETLYLNHNQITDVTPLASLTNVAIFRLTNNQITDVTPLASLINLEALHLNHNQITDVTPLASLTNLKTLDLSNNQITDITPLASLTNLKHLDLSNNQITDITPLASLTNLKTLDLNNNQITDVTPLASLINLEILNLRNNQITDVTPLASLTNLASLQLTNNPILTKICPVSEANSQICYF